VPFVVRPADRLPGTASDGMPVEWVIAPDRLPDRRLSVAILRLDPGATYDLQSPEAGLCWFQLLSGSLEVDGQQTTVDHIVMVAHGRDCAIVALEPSVLLLTQVPRAQDSSGAADLRRIDWSTEPVLLSEHDSRRRIYLASTGLWGTEAVKGEMIIYPPGAIGAAHHHEGAEHFQFIVSGGGTAVLGDDRVELGEGDLLYNLENEVHSFENLRDEDMVFVEFFVPGRNRTVWVPGASACAWNPLDTDVLGRPAARRLQAHVHGEGEV